jgi:hypothetical protein
MTTLRENMGIMTLAPDTFLYAADAGIDVSAATIDIQSIVWYMASEPKLQVTNVCKWIHNNNAT